MPALPAVPSVLRIALIGLFGEDTNIVNRWFTHYTGTAPTSSQLNTLAAAVLTAWAANMASVIQAGYATESVSIEDLSSATSAVGSAVGSHAGTDTGVTTFAGGAFIIQHKISRRYRGGHPRTYLAGCSPGHLSDDQTWAPSYAAAVITAWDSFMNAIASAVWSGATLDTNVNVSYYEGFHNFTYPSGRIRPIPTLRGTPLVDAYAINAANPRPGSQRRRNKQSV